MPTVDLHRLPLVPAPDLARLFGDRSLPLASDPDAGRLERARAALCVETRDPRLLRCALTDRGWCNEAETPPWVLPWPGNRSLADVGGPLLEQRGLEPSTAARRAEALGLWDHLWLAVGQRRLHGPGRERVLARGVAALVGALVQEHAGEDQRAADAINVLLGC